MSSRSEQLSSSIGAKEIRLAAQWMRANPSVAFHRLDYQRIEAPCE
jgi:hypothetical protein